MHLYDAGIAFAAIALSRVLAIRYSVSPSTTLLLLLSPADCSANRGKGAEQLLAPAVSLASLQQASCAYKAGLLYSAGRCGSLQSSPAKQPGNKHHRSTRSKPVHGNLLALLGRCLAAEPTEDPRCITDDASSHVIVKISDAGEARCNEVLNKDKQLERLRNIWASLPNALRALVTVQNVGDNGSMYGAAPHMAHLLPMVQHPATVHVFASVCEVTPW